MKAHEKDERCVHELHCVKCDYECQRQITLMKHMYTMHKDDNINETEYIYINEENDFLQIENKTVICEYF